MTVGALAYFENGYFPTRNTPVDSLERSAFARQAPTRGKPVGAAASALAPLPSQTAQKTKIYSANRVQVNEYMFDHAVLTKSMAHMRARAKMAMSNLPSSMPQAAAASASIARMPVSAPGAAASGAGVSGAGASGGGGRASAASGSKALAPKTECGACESRVYQDGSDDAGVSFQSPKGMPASLSGVMVAAHEGEHVTRESARALEEGSVITQKKVTMQAAFCPECHRLYYTGGTTTISTVGSDSSPQSDLTVKSAAETLENLGNAVDLYI